MRTGLKEVLDSLRGNHSDRTTFKSHILPTTKVQPLNQNGFLLGCRFQLVLVGKFHKSPSCRVSRQARAGREMIIKLSRSSNQMLRSIAENTSE